MPAFHVLAAAFLALVPPAAPDEVTLELPAGKAERALAGMGPETEPAELPPEFREGGDLAGAEAWRDARTFALWAEWLGDLQLLPERDGREAAALHARLALLALLHERYDDAWEHLARCGADPRYMALVRPHLLPGVPLGTPIGPGGVPVLEPGAVLRPCLPAPVRLPFRRPPEQRARIAGLPVGDATIELAVLVDASGLQVDLTHLSGPATEVRVLLADPSSLQIRIEYLDWMRQDTLGEPLPVELQPGSDTVTLFGRCLPREAERPSTAVGAVLPRRMRLSGLVFVAAEEEPEPERIAACAAAFAQVVEVPVRVVTPAEAGAGLSGTIIRLGEGEEREATLRWLVTAAEQRLLDR